MPKLRKEVEDKVLALIKEGYTNVGIAEKTGVHRKTAATLRKKHLKQSEIKKTAFLEGMWLRIEKDGYIVSYQRLNEKTFERLKQLLKLIEFDEDALSVLDMAIDIIVEPKREIAEIISNRLLEGLDKMPDMFKESLMALPMAQLRDMESKLDELTLRREPGWGNLYIEYGDVSKRIT
ncbi:unnamed protein product, partial [marine sediment metagenome]